MISSLPGPLETMVIGYPICPSINSMYLRQFSGSSSYFLIPRMSHFHPGSFVSTGFAFSKRLVTGNSVVTSPLISYPVHTGISSRYPNTSSTVNATSVVPCRRQPYLLATQSNHPILLGRPVVAPNSPPSPPRRRSSSASSPKISLTNAPAPTAEEYALHTVMICLISYGGTPAPIAPYAASVEDEVTIG